MAYVEKYNPTFGKLGVETSRLWPEKEVIKNKGKKQDTLGLALSGGGYRSAIFCYGVLKGLYDIGVLQKVDYLSAVSGGSWIATPFAMAENLDWFFKIDDDSANFMEEGFESLLWNPVRLAEEAALTRGSNNYVSDLFGRLLAKTFLREYGDYSRFKPLSEPDFVKDKDRPFLIVNGTVHFRRPKSFDVTQECFEMTRMYCGSRSIGYLDSESLLADKKPIRVRDAIAVSGAAVAVNVPGLGAEVIGLGLGREIVNYALKEKAAPPQIPESDRLDLDDGGHYNNLGVESLVNRGCGYIIVVDAEHDPENKTKTRSNQAYSGLKTLLTRKHIPQPSILMDTLDRANEAVHVFTGNDKVPDILYVKLKSSVQFDKMASRKKYNQPGFLKNLFANGKFAFDPQFSTAKLDYSFSEHRNLTELGLFFVKENAPTFQNFVEMAK
jgi:predicted acylesterase/phospholipase RssA